MNTVGIARPYVADAVKGGSSASSSLVLEAINRGQLELLANDDLTEMLQRRMKFSVRRNVLVCPREVESVLSYISGGVPGGMPRSRFYEFCTGGSWTSDEVSGVKADLVDWGDVWPTMFEIDVDYQPMHLYAFSSNAADAGVDLFVEGLDTNNQEILTNGIPGESVEIVQGLSGTTVTALNTTWKPSISTYKEITNVVKPITKGYVVLMAYDPTTYYWWTLAMYHPRETHPRFHRYKVTLPRCTDGACIIALVKPRHVPLEADTDVVLIQNLEALKMQILCNEYLQSDPNKSEFYRNKAITILRRDVAKKTPSQDFTLSGTWGLGRIEAM